VFTASLQPKWTTPDKLKSEGILQWRYVADSSFYFKPVVGGRIAS